MDYHRKAAPTDIAAIEDCETELDKISYRAGNAVDKTVVSNENCQYIRDTIDGLKDIWREPVRMYSVSYTHLDVYKRQGPDGVCDRRRRALSF